jgi:hypothetical protein
MAHEAPPAGFATNGSWIAVSSHWCVSEVQESAAQSSPCVPSTSLAFGPEQRGAYRDNGDALRMSPQVIAADKTSEVEAILGAAAAAENLNKLVVVRNLARRLCSGDYNSVRTPPSKFPEGITVREFAAFGTDGELRRRWPDHVEKELTATDGAWRLGKHINPVIGHIAVRDVTLELVDDVMSALPQTLARPTRRHVAQILVRLMNLATYPARLIKASPIPRGWLPKVGKKRNYPILMPSEDAALVGSTSIPIHRRLISAKPESPAQNYSRLTARGDASTCTRCSTPMSRAASHAACQRIRCVSTQRIVPTSCVATVSSRRRSPSCGWTTSFRWTKPSLN